MSPLGQSELSKIQIITLDNIYRNHWHPWVDRLFGRMIALKADGYGPPNYPTSTLPMDIHDFVCRHHLFCLPTPEGPLPIAGFKNTLLETCDFYNLVPPYLTLCHKAKAEAQSQALEEVFDHHRAQGKSLICSGGFTVLAPYRGKGSPWTALLRELVVAMMYWDHHYFNQATFIGGGVPRFKTDQLWQQTGYLRLQQNQKDVEEIKIPLGNDETMILMQMTRPSQWTQDCFLKHEALIRASLELGKFQKPNESSNESQVLL